MPSLRLTTYEGEGKGEFAVLAPNAVIAEAVTPCHDAQVVGPTPPDCSDCKVRGLHHFATTCLEMFFFSNYTDPYNMESILKWEKLVVSHDNELPGINFVKYNVQYINSIIYCASLVYDSIILEIHQNLFDHMISSIYIKAALNFVEFSYYF